MGTKTQMGEVSALLSVDGYRDKIVSGRFWWDRDGSETAFMGLLGLILLVEPLLEEMQVSGADCRCKHFGRSEPAAPEMETQLGAEPTRGALATFRLHILFRQNTSWQGLVTWVEERQERKFRSFLELAVLLDSALCLAEEEKMN